MKGKNTKERKLGRYNYHKNASQLGLDHRWKMSHWCNAVIKNMAIGLKCTSKHATCKARKVLGTSCALMGVHTPSVGIHALKTTGKLGVRKEKV